MNSGESHYKVNVRSQGTASATIHIKTDNPFLFGFSVILPDTINETSALPLPGIWFSLSFLFIFIFISYKHVFVECLKIGTRNLLNNAC